MSDISTVSGNKRPTSVTVIGIISIIYCGLGIIASTWSIIGQNMFSLFKDFAKIYEKIPEIPAYVGKLFDNMMSAMADFMPIFLIFAFLTMAVCGMGLGGGIGLLFEKKWSILLSKIFAVANIVTVIASSIVSGIMSQKMFSYMDEIISELPHKASPFVSGFMGGFMSMASTMGIVFGIIFGCAYPIIVLVFMSTKKVKSFFA